VNNRAHFLETMKIPKELFSLFTKEECYLDNQNLTTVLKYTISNYWFDWG